MMVLLALLLVGAAGCYAYVLYASRHAPDYDFEAIRTFLAKAAQDQKRFVVGSEAARDFHHRKIDHVCDQRHAPAEAVSQHPENDGATGRKASVAVVVHSIADLST